MAVRPVMRILRKAAPRSSLVILAAQLGSGVATAGLLLLTTDILSNLLATAPNADRLRAALPALAMLAAVYVLKMILDAAVLHARAHLVPKVRRLAEEELFHASLGVELAAFDDPGFYDQLHRARDRGVMHLEGATACLVDALSAAFAVAGAAVALLLLHPLLLVLLVLALLPEGWAALHAARLQYGGMSLTIAFTRRAQMMGELATERAAAPEIRANQAQEYVLSEFRRCAGELQDHLVRLGIAEARATTSGRLLSGVGLVGTFVALGWMLHQQWLDLAVAGTAVIAIRATSGSLRMFMQMMHELFEKGLYISDYREFTENSAARSRPRRGTAAPTGPGRIALENVGFRYPGEHGRTALRDLTLTIEAGQTVALVGENGSGKTTLAKLLAGLYRPGTGRIYWDGVDIHEMDPESLADRVVMVQQHPIRWPRSAEDNIRLGRYARADPEEAALMEAARQARATEVVETLPDGWRTLLSREFRGGQDLSAGQWQRLAVARGLYRDAPLVIWDEPTAPLDARAEHAVYESLRGLSRDRTVVMITHRLASVRNADRIFYLERGALVEQGTHRELLAMGGRYAELYRLQMQMHGPEGGQ